MQPIVAMCAPYGIMSIVKGKENKSTKELQKKTKKKSKRKKQQTRNYCTQPEMTPGLFEYAI